MADGDVLERMRADWNERAREDAHYYVAFGRREQDSDEFFASAADVVRALEAELKRFAGRGRALEIGCGPGRLMLPMSRHFGEVHGVDVSEEMIARARRNLAGVGNAFPRAASGADLCGYGDESFDFVYSYAVFQHIPSREVVFAYLAEARRVLKPGGVLKCQINGLPKTAARYNTWSGVRIGAEEVMEFARACDMQLLALEGVDTQYMWATMRKQRAGWRRGAACSGGARVRAVTNALSGEAVAPASGPFAAVSLWMEGLPAECDVANLEVRFEGKRGRVTYIGEPMRDGLCQVNAALPEAVRTGLVPVEIARATAWVRIIPAGPQPPRLCGVSDGIDLLAGTTIRSGAVKVTIENYPGGFAATVDGAPVREIESFCTDPLTQRYEINFLLPEGTAAGGHELCMRLGSRALAPVRIEAA